MAVTDASERSPRREVLVVEDDTGLARLEVRALQRAGFDVRVVASVEDALAAIREREPDCLVVDQRLSSGTTGLQLVARLPEIGCRAPALLVTGTDDPEVIVGALRAGVRDFLRKGPGLLELLVPRIDAIIEKAAMERDLMRSIARAEAAELRHRELELEVANRKRLEAIARNSARRLEEADRRKDEFLAMLGHELRNPLAPIGSAVELLRVHAASSEQIRWIVGVMDRQLHHLRRMVDDLLDVGRISVGNFAIELDVVAVADVVEQAVERCRPTIEGRGHELVVDVPPDAGFVHGDLTRLVQVVSNLLDNAAKYTPRGGRVKLRVESGDPVVIRVADTGIGLDQRQCENVFELFVQVSRDVARQHGGLGVGLNLARRIVELHGGSIRAHSEGLGRGSEFVVALPATTAARERDTEPAPADLRGAGNKVLIVDDNRDAADALSALLGAWGFRTETHYDGAAVVDAAERFAPRVAILDLGLPEVDGFELARRLRSRVGQDLLLVALSGYGGAADRQKSRAAGFDQHLVKPVDVAALRAVLQRLDRGRAADPG